MKCKLLSLSLLLLSSTAIHAMPWSEQPKACPSLASLKSVGLGLAMDSGIAGWMVLPTSYPNNYDTEESWTFMMFIGKATDENDALTKAKERLGQFALYEGPSNKDGSDDYQCVYFNPNSQEAGFAMATTGYIPSALGLAAQYK